MDVTHRSWQRPLSKADLDPHGHGASIVSDRPVRDLVVVGAGFVGCEVAWRTASLGASVELMTTSLDTVYACGADEGIAGGEDGSFAQAVADELGVSPGARVRAWDLHAAAKYLLESTPTLHLLQSNVVALAWNGAGVRGVETWEGVPRAAKRVVLAVGTFLDARFRRGSALEHAGRPGEMAYDDLAHDLRSRGVLLETRLDRGVMESGLPWSLAYAVMAPQAGGDHHVEALGSGCLQLGVNALAAGRCVGVTSEPEALLQAASCAVRWAASS